MFFSQAFGCHHVLQSTREFHAFRGFLFLHKQQRILCLGVLATSSISAPVHHDISPSRSLPSVCIMLISLLNRSPSLRVSIATSTSTSTLSPILPIAQTGEYIENAYRTPERSSRPSTSRTPARQTNQDVSARHHPEVAGYTSGFRSEGASSSNYHSGEATLPRTRRRERLYDHAYSRFFVVKPISPPLLPPPTRMFAVA